MTTAQVCSWARRRNLVLSIVALAGIVTQMPAPAFGQDPPPSPTPVAEAADAQAAPASAPNQPTPKAGKS